VRRFHAARHGNGRTGRAVGRGPARPRRRPRRAPPEAQPYGLDVYTAKCLSCHGDLGQGIGQVPALRGVTRAAMQQKLHDYRAGKAFGAQTAVMAQAVAALSDAEIAAVSIYAGE